VRGGVDLVEGDLVVSGRVMSASNATFVGAIGGVQVAYKPVTGERPLWDFPDGNLASREIAAYLVSESFGWNVVPHTWWRDGPAGSGMVQRWQEPDTEQHPIDIVPHGQMPDSGWCHVFDGLDGRNHPVSLIHEDSAQLRHMAVFDVVTNNADRKGGHVLAMPDGHRHGIDHGLTFHPDPKLRTVLWGWVGESLHTSELEGVERVRSDLAGDLGEALGSLLQPSEIAATVSRCESLLRAQRFPAPHGQMPAVPWPPF
jgi:uncharacterized repeat protein (TIGR03843 family)